MARCANEACGRWRPTMLARRGATGVEFDGRWFCSRQCVAEDTVRLLASAMPGSQVSSPTRRPLRLGTLLVHLHVVTPAQVQRALDMQRRRGRRLGEELIALGLASAADVARGLAAQAGVGFLGELEPERVATGCAGLSREAVRALGVVPFESRPVEHRLRVACAAPLRRMAIAALREITGCAIDPFIVPDAVFASLMAAYGTVSDLDSPLGTAARGVLDAAELVARAAEQHRTARLRHARCDPYMWIRLEGASGAEDVVLPLVASHEER